MPWCSPLILHLSFNEGHGRTIHDSSPSALHVELDPSSPLSNDGATLAGEPGWVTGQGAVCGAALVSPFAIILRWGQSSARMSWRYVHFERLRISGVFEHTGDDDGRTWRLLYSRESAVWSSCDDLCLGVAAL